MPVLHSTESSEEYEVLLFLEDVVRIDVTKYDVTLWETSVTYPDWLNGLPQVTGKYGLESETSKLDVLFKFRNKTLSWCLVRTLEGSPHYLDVQSKNIRDLAKDFLDRYQVYSGDSELEEMANIIALVDVEKNSTITMGNLELTVSVTSFSSYFDWRCICRSAYSGGVDVSFREGKFYAFGDDRSYYQLIKP